MKDPTVKIKNFHAHVYFNLESREAAARIREGLNDHFEVQLGRWHDAIVGPHPKSMYQALFLPEQFTKVVPWLIQS
jgi:aromatic ring-cleaving dioxygenase